MMAHDFEQLRANELDRARQQQGPRPAMDNAATDRTVSTAQIAAMPRDFKVLGEDRYLLEIAGLGLQMEVEHLRREHHQLFGELAMRCRLAGARAIDSNGTLSIAELNMSSAQQRSSRARLLASRARVTGVDWEGILEDFCQRVFLAERQGAPAVDLRELPPVTTEETLDVLITVPRHHPAILFGDGGCCKSYLALYIAGKLAESGTRVALFDWELAGDDHRDRLERLFPDGMPRILYARCERPLIHEVDRLKRLVRDNSIEYMIYDSVAFAADGPPEAAEVAGRYFRAVRQIGGGSLHIAHISKGDNSDKKPFGSTFWHNGARSTWNVQLGESTAGTDTLTLGLFNRKANLGRLCAPVGLDVTFAGKRTVFRRGDVADSPDLAPALSVGQRMAHVLKTGAMTPERIAEEIDSNADTVGRTARRKKDLFVILEGGKIGLLDKHQRC
jgi:hypothetical protein